MHSLLPPRPTRVRGAGGGRQRGFRWLCVFITLCTSQWLKILIYCEYGKVVTTTQRGRTAHLLLCTKSSALAGTASLAASLSSRSVWSSSTSICRTSNLRLQSFTQCPGSPQRRQVSGSDLVFRVASISIGTPMSSGGAMRGAGTAGGGRINRPERVEVGAGAAVRCGA